MVVGEPKRSIMDGIENTGDVRLHDHRLRLKQRFDIIRKLGQGTYGKVQLGINKKTGQEVAIKTIKKCKIETEADLVRIRREVQIMSSVRHPNIVHIYEVFENSEKMILVMEYCAGGELYDYLSQQKVLQEDEARRLFRQIATAVYYCHKHKICHRDLKLENVLLDEHGSAKIADFGLSNVFEERRLLSTFCGSPLYASPEIVKGTPYIGPEVDCWSLGVLLYTLVYGAMPFDGSNFKRLVKQISTGDYFEPKNPSSASPLIRDMLTVDPIQRADVTHICDNPWVNKGSEMSCLELAEALANETPVRLDLLLSLVPPPNIGDDKLVVTDEVSNVRPDGSPSRSMSTANIDNSAERRILEMVAEGGTDAIKPSPTRTILSAEQPKRKLETTVSMDSAPSQRKKERSIRTSSSVTKQNSLPADDASMTLSPNVEINRNASDVIEDLPMDDQIKDFEINSSPSDQQQESLLNISPKVSNTPITTNLSQLTLEIPNEAVKEVTAQQSPEKNTPVTMLANKEIKLESKNKENVLKEKNVIPKPAPALKKRIVTSSLNKDDKTKSTPLKEKSPPRKSIEKDIAGRVLVSDKKIDDKKNEEPIEPSKQRRRSRVLDTTEKLNNLSLQPSAPSVDNQAASVQMPKPKKVVIPGISVGSFKEQFERRASLTSANTSPSVEQKKPITKPTSAVGTFNSRPSLNKKVNSLDSEHPLIVSPVNEIKDSANIRLINIGVEPSPPPKEDVPKLPVQDLKKPAIVEINKTSKVLHKSESLREPTNAHNEFNLSLDGARRSLQQSMALLNQARSESKQSVGSDDVQLERQKQLKTAREIISNAIGDDGKKVNRTSSIGGKPPVPYGSGGRSSSGTISLHSLSGSPPMSPPHSSLRETPLRNFRTEVHHRVDDVRNKYTPHSRGGSVERIIPIHFASEVSKTSNASSSSSGQLPYQRNNSVPYRFSSLPRGCTSDNESQPQPQPQPISHSKPIKKSPREFIIPIDVEGKGYVTPRQGSLEPSDTPTKINPANIGSGFMSRFPKPRRLGSLASGADSEDDSDMPMHRLRSSRRVRNDAEKESVSSGEDDEDERFVSLTAENLFSTLLDRVRSVTNKFNGEEGTAFPLHHQSIFNNLHSPFFNSTHLPRTHKRQNIIREGPAWRRSTSRDIGADFDSLFQSPFPRGSRKSRRLNSDCANKKLNNKNTAETKPDIVSKEEEHLDLSDLDLSKMEISDKDMEMLSGLTPALSRRLQKQLLDQLPPAAASSLRRTLSMNHPPDKKTDPHKYYRSLSATKTCTKYNSLTEEDSVSRRDCRKENDSRASYVEEDEASSVSNSHSLRHDGDSIAAYDCFDSILSHNQSSNSLDIVNSRIDSLSDSITPKNSLTAKSTPDRSVLGKYHSPERHISKEAYGLNKIQNDYYTSYNLHHVNLDNTAEYRPILRQRSLKTPPTDTAPRRRISRFLRPDFFDTPREESIYVREKLDKENETQRVLREIRDKKNRSDGSTPNSPSVNREVLSFFDNDSYTNGINCLSPLSPLTPSRSRSVTPFYPMLDNISEIQNNSSVSKEYESFYEKCQNINDNLDIKPTENTKTESNSMIARRESKLIRPKSFPSKQIDNSDSKDEISNKNVIKDILLTEDNVKKESKIMRPKSYPTTTSPEKKSSDIQIVESNSSKQKIVSDKQSADSVNNNVSNTTPKNVSPAKDDNGNVTVSFNINLPVKNTKVDIKAEEKKTPPKKKVVVKKKLVSKSKSVVKDGETNGNVLSGETHLTTNVLSKEPETKTPKKKSVLQSIGQKFERLRNDSFSKNVEKENAIEIADKASAPINKKFEMKSSNRSLREQSVPTASNIEPVSESGLIKRAVTITDLQTLENKTNNSKKTVNRVFGIFKKADSKEKSTKPNIDASSVIIDKPNANNADSVALENKPKRPTSLLLNGIGKRVQACYNGSSSDIKPNDDTFKTLEDVKLQKKGLRLDFSRLPKINQGIFQKRNSLDLTKNKEYDTKDVNDNRQAESVTSDSELYIPPVIDYGHCDDVLSNGDTTSPLLEIDARRFMTDTKSDCENDATSPETENLIDRIRRKSFYSRFNEKKQRRKSSLVGPGAKEYIPSVRINPQSDNDNYKYDLQVPSKYPYANEHKVSECGVGSRLRTWSQDISMPGSYDSQYTAPRYSRTLPYLTDGQTDSGSGLDRSRSRSRYGRTLSLLSPGIYATYTPRSATRNSAILLRDTKEDTAESILSKIRTRNNATTRNNYDDGQSLETKYRSIQMHDSEHDPPDDYAE